MMWKRRLSSRFVNSATGGGIPRLTAKVEILPVSLDGQQDRRKELMTENFLISQSIGQSQKPEPSGVPPLFPPLTTFGSDDTRRPRNNNNGVLFGGTGETSQTNNHGLPIRQNTTSGGLFGQPPQSQVRGTGLFGMPQPSQADDNKDSYAR